MARTLSARELCSEAGASLERVEWLTRIGILQPRAIGRYTSGDVFRVKMIGSLLEAGFTPAQVEAAVEAAGLDLRHVDRYVLVEPAERSTRTFARFAAELGRHAEPILIAAYQLLGVAPPAPESHLPVDEEELLRALLEAWSLARDEDAPLRAARLLGEGTRTATMGWADLLYEQMAGPARERWLRREVDEYPREVTEAVASLFALLPRLTRWLIQRYIEQIVTAGIAENFEELLASRGLGPAPEPADPPAVVFVDITGYTTITEQRGDEAAVHIATALQQRAEQVAAERGGRVLKLLGDGAMLLFRDPGAGVDAATSLVRMLREDLGVEAHGGVHVGWVIERDRDLFGSTVNVAARVSAAAGPGEVLVTDAAARATGLDGSRIESVEPAPLKGVSHPVRLFRIRTS